MTRSRAGARKSPLPPEDPGELDGAHAATIAVCALGFSFDLAEIVLSPALSAVFSTPPHAESAARIAWLLAAVYLGAILGAPALGAVADRKGRRRALCLSMVLLAATSTIAAICPGITSLSAARFGSGVALGAYPPLMIAYLVDVLPPRSRGAGILATVAIGYLGPPAVVFLMRRLTALAPLGWEGWRWTLLAGGVGAAIAAISFLRLHGPVPWAAGASAAPVPAPLNPPGFLRLAILSFLSPWATVAFPLLTGVLLVQKGIGLSDTFLYIGVSTLGPFIATGLAALGADRIERRTALILCAGGMPLFAVMFWATMAPAGLMVSVLGFNLLVALYLPALSVYTAESFPTPIRARVTTRAWALNRVAAALGPLLLLPLLERFGASALIVVVLAVMGASVVLIASGRSPDRPAPMSSGM